MPALAPPVHDERHALREFLAYQQSAFVAVAYGLTDNQARATPTVSALSIGGLIKHATGMQPACHKRAAGMTPVSQCHTRGGGRVNSLRFFIKKNSKNPLQSTIFSKRHLRQNSRNF